MSHGTTQPQVNSKSTEPVDDGRSKSYHVSIHLTLF
jgi:hypothetical protein